MANTNTSMNEHHNSERLVLILLGAISGILSIAILTEYIQANEWLAPILGILSILLLMSSGILGDQDHNSTHKHTR